MSEETGTLQRIAEHLARTVQPLDRAFRDPEAFQQLMVQLGWEVQGLPPSYVTVADAAVQAVEAVQALADEADTAEIADVLVKAGDVYRAIDRLGDAPVGVDPGVFLAELARRLFELLLAEQLLAEAPAWFSTLESLGVIALEDHPPADGRPGFTRIRFDWDQIPQILSDPGSIPARLYGWGTPELDFPKLADVLGDLLSRLGLPTSLDQLSAQLASALQAEATGTPERPTRRALTIVLFDFPIGDTIQEVGFMVAELPAEGPALPGLIVQLVVPDGIAPRIELGGGWAFALRAGTDLAEQLGVVVRPGGVSVRHPFAPGQPLPSAGFGIALSHAADRPLTLFGQPGRSRLELAAAQLGLTVDLRAGDLELKGGLGVQGLAFVLSAADLDNFLGSALGAEELRVQVPFGISWSNRTGLDFIAGLGFEKALYPHLDVGVLRFDRVDLAVRFVAATGVAPQLDLRAAISFSGVIGPVAYAVDRVGADLAVTFAEGNAGPFNLQLRPLWPTGLGLAIDAGPVTGGGFIAFDPERGRYTGILQLDVFEIGVTAIAILDTRDADGRDLPPPGFSFLIIIAGEFPPIQLGYGFTLNGVGGLAAINRRLDTAALLAGVRTGAVDSILFPDDPVRDAPSIVSNLSAIFPIAMGRYLFGPMARLGWGTPTLLRIELAVVLEVPDPVMLALLGQASMALPDEDAALVSIHVDVVGVVDFGRSLLAVDASLRDSYVAAFALLGDMAMRLAFGAEPNFAFAVGGLNPHFSPPPGFPVLRRVTVALGLGHNPRVSLEGYVGVTSNSLQFGAKAELYAEAAGLNVHGWLSFDALFVFIPFSFRLDFSVGMSLNVGSTRIAGVRVHGTLTGPNPFHAWGEGCLSLLFFDICVPFNATFGERRAAPELPPADPWPLLRDAIGLAENWSAELPGATAVAVSLRPPEAAPALLLLHPMGAAVLRQKVVPLNRTLERFGQYAISGPNRFDVAAVEVGDRPANTWATTTDHFAPGDFEQLSDSEKLSRDSFEPMDAGVRVGTTMVDAPLAAMKTAMLEYETKIIDTPWRSRVLSRSRLDRAAQLLLADTGAKAGSPLARAGRGRFARDEPRPPAVVLDAERWAVATTATLAARPDVAARVTKGAAHVALKHTAAAGLQVVAEHELQEVP
jgi:hypothetical protein